MYFFEDYGGIVFGIIGVIIVFIIIRAIRVKNKKRLSNSTDTEQGFIAMRGKTNEQKQIIKYFSSTGIFGFIFKISNSVFDTALYHKIENCKSWINARAINVHGIDVDEVKEISPILIGNYSSDSRYFKIFNDGIFRASEYQMTYLLFGEKQMYAYCNKFDMTSENTTERTREYFYEDITNIDVTQKKVEIPNPRKRSSIICGIILIIFSLLLSGVVGIFFGICSLIAGIIVLIFVGYSRSVVDYVVLRLSVAGSSFECDMKPGDMPAIQGMKAKIREKKK
jgi:hypothetical protein